MSGCSRRRGCSCVSARCVFLRARREGRDVAPGSLGDLAAQPTTPSSPPKGRVLPGELYRISSLLCGQLPVHGVSPGTGLSLRRWNLSQDPALPGVDHTVLSEVGTARCSWEDLCRRSGLFHPSTPHLPPPRGRNYGAVGLRIPSLNNPAKHARRESQARPTDGVIRGCKWKDGGFECSMLCGSCYSSRQIAEFQAVGI